MPKKKEPKYELVPVGDNPVTVAEPIDEEMSEEHSRAENEEVVEQDQTKESPSRVDKRYTKYLKVVLTNEEKLNAAIKKEAQLTQQLTSTKKALDTCQSINKEAFDTIKQSSVTFERARHLISQMVTL